MECKWARTCADVVPIRIVRGKLLVRARLDEIDPIRNLELAGAL